MHVKDWVQCLTYGKHTVSVNYYHHLHQNYGADEFVLGKGAEKRRRMKTKSGEPTLKGEEMASTGVREWLELRGKPEISFYPTHPFSSGKLLLILWSQLKHPLPHEALLGTWHTALHIISCPDALDPAPYPSFLAHVMIYCDFLLL